MDRTFWRLIAVCLILGMPPFGMAAPLPSRGSEPENPREAAIRALDKISDIDFEGKSLQDVMDKLKEETKLPVILDSQFTNFGMDPNQMIINVKKMKQVKLKDALKAALAQFNLRYGMTSEGWFISTEEGVTIRQLRQRIQLDCDRAEIAATLKQLATDTGANLVVDPRVGENAKQAVTLKLEDVPVETAVRLLAEVADLRAVRSNNVLFITTPEKARYFRDDGPIQASPASSFHGFIGFGGLGGGFGGFGGIGGGMGGFGGIGAPGFGPPGGGIIDPTNPGAEDNARPATDPKKEPPRKATPPTSTRKK